MQRRLKPVKDLSVLIVAPRRHDQTLWKELLKNCGINHPTALSDIHHASVLVGSGQADVVFVDESYGAQGIAHMLIPARSVEFAGGRGVCLILCSKQATAADVLNARRLGFASLVILPASTETVRKHLELAARYIPPSDEELGWSVPVKKDETESKPLPEAKDDPVEATQPSKRATAAASASAASAMAALDGSEADIPASGSAPAFEQASPSAQEPAAIQATSTAQAPTEPSPARPSSRADEEAYEPAALHSPGRSGKTADEEVVFL